MDNRTGLAVVGCGYVANFYARNLAAHPSLQIRGCFDTHAGQLERFARCFSIPAYENLQAILEDSSVAIVLNLTNPRSHFEITQACLLAGKHVYSEKPLAMTAGEAQQLADLAHKLGLRLSCAPCSVLSDTAQTLWKAISEGAVGKIRLVYANFDDGMIAPNMSPWNWTVESGAHWPAKDEFEIGCTYEHAGYFLTWLGAFFGPATRVHAYSSCLIPDKGIPVDGMAPDFSSGCIEYAEGVVARVTCGLVAPHDKSMTVVGDSGILYVRFLRNDAEPVYLRQDKPPVNAARVESRVNRFKEDFRAKLEKFVPWPMQETRLFQQYPRARQTTFRAYDNRKTVDFLRGPRDMAEALTENRPHRLSADFAVHMVELLQALQHPPDGAGVTTIQSRFEPIAPLPWS